MHSPVKPFPAIEWLQPGEGEETAALRLLRCLPTLYGSRFFDILLLDALYAQTTVLELLRQVGWDAVISLKQNFRDLYQSAVRLFARRTADVAFTEPRGPKTYQAQLWDAESLPFALDNPEPVRWCVPKRCSSGSATAKENEPPMLPIMNDFGSLLSPNPSSRLAWFANWGTPVEKREQRLDGPLQILGFQTRISARLSPSP